MSNNPNKIKYNLKNVHVAKMTETAADGETTYTYEKPKAVPGAVSLSLEAQGETSPFYADGVVYFRSTSNNGYSGDLELALVPEWFCEEMLQETKDKNGVLVETNDHAESVKFAMLFEFDGDAHGTRHVMYNCTAARPAVASQTKENNITPVTEKLSLTVDPRADGLVKSRTGDDITDDAYQNWYKSVYVPVNGGE